MQSTKFSYSGTDELEKAMERAGKVLPEYTEIALKKEARAVAKELKSRVDEEAKGHGKKPGTLKRSFKPGKVIKSGSNYTAAVLSSAPHYHLYEEGHDMISHKRKNKSGKGKVGTGKFIKEVHGRKTVARYMAQRSENAEEIAEKLLDDILKEAGLL